MGTSVNQRSADTPSWQAARVGYQADIPINRVVAEVWRAAAHEDEASWQALLSSPAVQACRVLANERIEASAAVQLASREIATNGWNSISADLAKRALVVALQRPEPAASFASVLFQQVTDYLVSRDLPGYVGTRGRNSTVSQAIEFKRQIARRVASVVSDHPSSGDWSGDVSEIVATLARSGRQ